MTQYGFTPRIRDQRFYRPVEFGWWLLHLAFIPRVPYTVTANVDIRVDAVHAITDANVAIPEREKKRAATVGAELGNIADGRQHPWYVQPTDDLDAVADEIVHMYVSFGLPYLERLSDLEVMLEALSQHGPSGVIYCPFASIRCPRAVALALVLGHNDRAAALVAECGRDLKKENPLNARLFEILAERQTGPPREQ